MRIYISMPISGYDLDERKAEAQRIRARLREALPNSSIVTPFDVCDEPDKTYGYYMGKDIEAILDSCDGAYFAKGFSKSQGCLLEYCACTIYGKWRTYEDGEERINFLRGDMKRLQPSLFDNF